MQDLLRAMFDAAVAAALPIRIVPPHLPAPPKKGRTIVLGAGKASAAMAKAVEEHWPGSLEGLVVTRYGHAAACKRIEIVEAAHPVPDEAGRAAAERILDLAGGAGPDHPRPDQLCRRPGGAGTLPDRAAGSRSAPPRRGPRRDPQTWRPAAGRDRQ